MENKNIVITNELLEYVADKYCMSNVNMSFEQYLNLFIQKLRG